MESMVNLTGLMSKPEKDTSNLFGLRTIAAAILQSIPAGMDSGICARIAAVL